MQKKPNRFMLWVIGLVVAALVLTDMLPMFVQAREAEALTPAITQAVDDGRILVAQQEQIPPRKKRRTLMDLLFGDQQPEEQAPVVEKPVVKKQKKAALPPPEKPRIEKAVGATRLAVFGDSMATDVGKALERFYAEDPNISILTQGVGSSSFVRPDFFDWPKTISEQIAANKVHGVRAALVWSIATAELAREHNDANVISIGARQHTVDEAIAFIDRFIATPFSGEERHARRIAQLAAFETDGTLVPDPRAGTPAPAGGESVDAMDPEAG